MLILGTFKLKIGHLNAEPAALPTTNPLNTIFQIINMHEISDARCPGTAVLQHFNNKYARQVDLCY